MSHYDVIIAGSGPAGLTAGIYAGRSNLNCLIIEKLFAGGQISTTSEVENYPGTDPMSGPELAMKMASQAEKFGAKTAYEEITSLNLSGKIKQITTTTNTYTAKTVILCMGAKPRQLGLPNEPALLGRGVSYCATCDGNFYKGKTAAVVGGGDTALEDALHLSRICETVHLIHRRDTFRGTPLLADTVKQTPNIQIHYNHTVTALNANNTLESITIQSTTTDDSSTLPTNALFIAVGTTPQTDLVQDKITLDNSNYIPTTDSMQTNIPGVFAAGDIRQKTLRQVVTAAADGAIAAFTAANYILEDSWE